MTDNYTPLDLVATAASIPVFAVFLFAPGYLFGWATNLLKFNRASITEQVLLSVPLSLAVSTVVTNLAGRYVPSEIILWIFLAAALVVLVRLFVEFFWRCKAGLKLRRSTRIVLVLAGIWTLGMIGCLIDLQFGNKLNVNAAMYDHAVRVAFLHAALRSRPPLKNPFSYIGYAPVARYYYYWYVLCSYPARLANISARSVLYGSSIWAGFSLAALIPLFLKDFFRTGEHVRRKSVIGILLLSVTGLDIIPTLYELMRANTLSWDMEAWDPSQVTSWQDAFIWVPHHVASLAACFIGFLALWSVRAIQNSEESTRSERMVAGMFAALAFSAAAGLSAYVTFAFALFLVCWGLRFIWKRMFQDLFLYLWTAALSVAISLPYLHDLLRSAVAAAGARGGGGEAPKGVLAFGLRSLPGFLSTPHFLLARGFSHPELLAPFGVVAVYILEFGFFAIVGWQRLRQDIRKRSALSEAEIAAWYLLAVSMFIITFMRSNVIANNDLAFRSAMIAQLVLLLWGADYLDTWVFSIPWNWRSRVRLTHLAVAGTLFLGLVSSFYGVWMLRVYTVLEDHGLIAYPAVWLSSPPNVGAKLLAIRRAYEKLDRTLPSDSIVQYNPMTANYIPLLEYDKFQSVDAFPDCGTEFGGDGSLCPPVQDAIADLFNQPGNADLRDLCSRLSIDVLVARESDPAWRDRSSWVWRNRPIVENRYIRAFRCR